MTPRYPFSVPPQGSDTLCSRFLAWVPDFQGFIVGAGDESAIGEQGDAVYPVSVSPQGSDTLCCRFHAWVPDFQGFIVVGAGDESAIGEQGDAAYPSVCPRRVATHCAPGAMLGFQIFRV